MSDTADTQAEEVNAEVKQGLTVCDRSMAIPMHCRRFSGNQDFDAQLSTIEGMGANPTLGLLATTLYPIATPIAIRLSFTPPRSKIIYPYNCERQLDIFAFLEMFA
jgi:hypothetical protein